MVGHLVLPSPSIFQAEEDKATLKAALAEQESSDEEADKPAAKAARKQRK